MRIAPDDSSPMAPPTRINTRGGVEWCMPELVLDTASREEFIDITGRVQRLVGDSGLQEGLVHLWCCHTTAGLLCNEHADPDVMRDVLMTLDRIVPDDLPYRHAEDNSPAHVKSILTSCSLTLPVRQGRLALGRWQGIFFAEFDGPRRGRRIVASLIPTAP
jgi:secondary thiamine-phosphate synthase enzyme